MAVGNRSLMSLGCNAGMMGLKISGTGTFAAAAQNAGVAFRHQAESASAVLGVRIYWNTITSPGTVTVTYQPIDATTGKPTNSAYDANATWTGTPTAGWQTITFASAPTTARTRGADYAIVVITATAGTTHTIRHVGAGGLAARLPSGVLTTTDAGTTWAEVAGAAPMATVQISGADEVACCLPFSTTASDTVYGNRAAGMKVVVPAGIVVDGVGLVYMARTGTPDGDLRVRVLDCSKEPCAIGASGYVVATGTADKDDMASLNNRSAFVTFDSQWTTTAGTFRVVIDQTSGNTSGNNWGVSSCTGISGVSYTNLFRTSTTDLTGNPISWTDTDTDLVLMELVEASYTAPASSGGAGGACSLIGAGLIRGLEA